MSWEVFMTYETYHPRCVFPDLPNLLEQCQRQLVGHDDLVVGLAAGDAHLVTPSDSKLPVTATEYV